MRAELRAFMQASPWAPTLAPETVDRLFAATRVRQLRPGALLCRQGEVATHWYGIVDGLLRLDIVCEDGTTVSLTTGPARSWFGEAALLSGQPRNHEVSAMRASRVACTSAAAFRRALDDDPGFNAAMLQALATRVQLLTDLFARERAHDPERRIAAILLSLLPRADTTGDTQIDIAQEELAQLAGVARQRANRALRALQARGLIETAYASIRVLDAHRLGEP